MIQGKLLSFNDDLSEVYKIRKKVFVEELGIPESTEFDELDHEAIHVLVYDEASKRNDHNSVKTKSPVATGRIEYYGEYCKIGHIGVLKDYRNLKYGDFTVKMLINRAFTAGIKTVTMTCKLDVEDFFHKIGFVTVNYDDNIDEVKMKIAESNIIKACNR